MNEDYLPPPVECPPCFCVDVSFLLGLRPADTSDEDDIALEVSLGLCPASLLVPWCESTTSLLAPLWWSWEERSFGALNCKPLSSSESEELESELESSERRPPPENSSLVDWLSTSWLKVRLIKFKILNLRLHCHMCHSKTSNNIIIKWHKYYFRCQYWTIIFHLLIRQIYVYKICIHK